MSDCRRIIDRLTSYVDEVLPPDEKAEVQRHLQACPPCRTAAEQERGGRAALRQRCRQLRAEAVPPALRSRCEALARECGRRSSAAWLTRLLPVALATLLIGLTGTAIFALATERSDALLAAQLAADHVKCFRLFPPEDGGAAGGLNAHDVEQMLETRYGWDLHVPPSSDANGIRLTGARRCLYGEGRVPHVMYQAHGQNMSLFILEGETRRDSEYTALGQHARIWSRGPNTFVLVSSAADTSAAQAAGYIRQEAH